MNPAAVIIQTRMEHLQGLLVRKIDNIVSNFKEYNRKTKACVEVEDNSKRVVKLEDYILIVGTRHKNLDHEGDKKRVEEINQCFSSEENQNYVSLTITMDG